MEFNYKTFTANMKQSDNFRIKEKEIEDICNKAMDEFIKLTEQEQKYLLAFIQASYRPRATVNNRCTSYGLKHEFERWMLGFYITNDQFKGAMLASKYIAYNIHDINWNFNVQKHKYHSDYPAY
jgi:hypothetical protein